MKLVHNIKKLIEKTGMLQAMASPGSSRMRFSISPWVMAMACLLSVSLVSCSVETDPEIEGPIQQDNYNLTLSIPEISFGVASRSGIDELEAQEGNLKSLYLVIFKKDEEAPGEVYDALYCGNIKQISEYKDAEGRFTIAPRIAYVEESGDAHLDNDYRDNFNMCCLNLSEGHYKFYLLGNIYEYWDNGVAEKTVEAFQKAISTEQGIRDLSLKFVEPLTKYLPMICMADRVGKKSDGTELLPSGVFEITNKDVNDSKKGTTNLFAPLTILCSKVRYTILFDNTQPAGSGDTGGFSAAFKVADVNFTFEEVVDEDHPEGIINDVVTKENGVTITNLSFITPVTLPAGSDESDESDVIEGSRAPEDEDDSETDGNEGEFEGEEDATETFFTASLSQVKYPSQTDGTKAYFDIVKASKSPDYLDVFDEENVNGWNPTNQRAWQGGAIYLPENLDTENPTTLHFLARGTGVIEEGYKIPLKLARGTFYDVVAKVISTSSFEVKIYIKVNPWVYHSHNAEW